MPARPAGRILKDMIRTIERERLASVRELRDTKLEAWAAKPI